LEFTRPGDSQPLEKEVYWVLYKKEKSESNDVESQSKNMMKEDSKSNEKLSEPKVEKQTDIEITIEFAVDDHIGSISNPKTLNVYPKHQACEEMPMGEFNDVMAEFKDKDRDILFLENMQLAVNENDFAEVVRLKNKHREQNKKMKQFEKDHALGPDRGTWLIQKEVSGFKSWDFDENLAEKAKVHYGRVLVTPK